MNRAFAGDGCICFVTGEPGAGKSALLEAFAWQAKQAYPELVIAAGDCNPQIGSQEPYLPFREILADFTDENARQSGPDGVDRPSSRFLQAARRVVVEHGPDLIDIFIPGGALITRVGAQAARQVRNRRREAGQIKAIQAGIDQGHLFEQYTNVLHRLSSRQPLMLFIDDLHWADEASVNLLFHLSRRLNDVPVLLVGAYRGADLATEQLAGQALAGKLNEFKRDHGDVWVDLRHIDPGQALAFTQALIDAEPNRLDERFREALFRRTGGQALFTVELLRHMKEAGHLQKSPDGYWETAEVLSWEGLPARIEGVISERAATLDEAERQLLEAASVMGESFLADVVAQATDRNTQEVIRSLSGALTRKFGLVIAEGFEQTAGQRVARYHFRHNLFQEYFYHRLDPIERVLLHEAVGLALEVLYQDASAEHAAQLAWHFGVAGLADKAIRYHVQAGHRARDKYANAEALAHYRPAVSLLENTSGPEFEAPRSDHLLAELWGEMGRVLQLDGQFEAAKNAFAKALELTPETEQLVRVHLHRGIAGALERLRAHARATSELAQAAELLGAPGAEYAEDWWSSWISVTMDRVRVYYWAGDVEAMSPLLDQLGDVIEQRGNAHQRCHFWTGQAMRGYRVDRYRPSAATLAAVEKALAASREEDHLLDLSGSLFGMGFATMMCLEPGKAIPYLQEALEIAQRCGDRHMRARNLAYLLNSYRLEGNVEAVQGCLPLALAAATDCDMQDYIGVAEATSAWLAYRLADMPAAERRARAALERWSVHAPRYPMKWMALFPLLA
ncbi:MAG: AAA family ATPase, partial [Gammaproteobacteria bacterium]|nr:AAA family ATPase [Gammaproteobacteria bacterium]